jgi:hypothetical protein
VGLTSPPRKILNVNKSEAMLAGRRWGGWHSKGGQGLKWAMAPQKKKKKKKKKNRRWNGHIKMNLEK